MLNIGRRIAVINTTRRLRRRPRRKPIAPSTVTSNAILDEIDGVLESNAEDFVKSFVQKGGQ